MLKRAAFFVLTTLAIAACAEDDATNGAGSGVADAQAADAAAENAFRNPIPSGNGRACATCHVPEKNFTITPADVEAAYGANPNGPLFQSIDADDFASDFSTLRNFALFRVTIPLPANVSIVGSAAREVKIFRAVPSIFDVKLTAPYTSDGRELTLLSQANAAANEHSRPNGNVGNGTLKKIVDFELAQFSSPMTKAISDAIDAGQAPPPVGQDYEGGPLTAEEQQGFAIFQQKCLLCHGGNTRGVSSVFPANFFSIGISERNRAGLPTLQYDVVNPDGSVTRTAPTPDPGRMLVTGKASDLNAFEMTQLRGISRTAPFFHDNSSPDMVSVLRHYNGIFPFVRIAPIPEEQFPALIAYLNRL